MKAPENPMTKRRKPCVDCGAKDALATPGLQPGRVFLCLSCFEKREAALPPIGQDGLVRVVPCSITDANAFVARFHRHHPPMKAQFLFAVGIAKDDGTLLGVAIIGRPASRMLEDGKTAEVRRVCVREGIKNGCSMLLGAARRAAFALGYKSLLTYTLPEEGGASLRGAGFQFKGEAGGGSWSRPSRGRAPPAQGQKKHLWGANA